MNRDMDEDSCFSNNILYTTKSNMNDVSISSDESKHSSDEKIVYRDEASSDQSDIP